MTGLAAALLEATEQCVRQALPEVANDLVDRVEVRAPIRDGDTRRSLDSRVDGLDITVFADTDQAKFTDVGTRPHLIRATRGHGILSDGGSFFVGGSANRPAEVQHPGSTKHQGWFSDAPWETWVCEALEGALR